MVWELLPKEKISRNIFNVSVLFLQSALAAALVNIKLPLMVGEVVNVVSRFAKDSSGDFLAEIKKPALRLIGTYLLQVNVGFCDTFYNYFVWKCLCDLCHMSDFIGLSLLIL